MAPAIPRGKRAIGANANANGVFDPNHPPFNPLADALDRTTLDMRSVHAAVCLRTHACVCGGGNEDIYAHSCVTLVCVSVDCVCAHPCNFCNTCIHANRGQ